ncbi:MAG: methyltransferase domain-containing protein [Actinomycetota bacterium]|nr:methyltransferase domain-containing protein [Actinomycetota bacterium]
MPADPDVFDNHLADWDAYLATPWAQARYDVVAHMLDETLARMGPGPLRVLDLGGGDGLDSVRLTKAGHDVTIVDQAPGMLGRARASAQRAGCSDRCRTVESDLVSWHLDRPYDVVLCHFVLQYLQPEDERRVWQQLREAVRPGGAASVICPNPVSEILRAVYRDGDAELALRRLYGEPVRTPTFDREVRQLHRADAERKAAAEGLQVTRRVGLRVAVDMLQESEAKHDKRNYPAILRLELALAEREPYLDIARAWQLLLR